MDKKYFSLDEANAVLPKIKDLINDLRETYKIRQKKYAAYTEKMVDIASTSETFSDPEFAVTSKTLERASRKMQSIIDEIQDEFGCVVKGVDPVLVDFFHMRDEKEVFLCWKEGEKLITHWHDLETGFSGRQPI